MSIFLASSFSCSQALSTPAHTQVTQTVGWQVKEQKQRNKIIMNIIEEIIWEERPLKVTWRDKSFIPPLELITQASGLCFTDDSKIVLVTADRETWQLVGGHPQTNETIENAFIREVSEEACATVTEIAYLGAQEVSDPQSPTGFTVYYQARFYARVMLGEFTSKHEIIERKRVEPSAVKSILNWRTSRIFDVILQAALEYEQRFRINLIVAKD
jgi:ADP-ribose pyrophosphatase YjhB (NUDIX family)